ncbi:hypothetical protein A2U01_0054198, partial [Trifolium medium]|nr:hypothetical protein [Trifolium medium]
DDKSTRKARRIDDNDDLKIPTTICFEETATLQPPLMTTRKKEEEERTTTSVDGVAFPTVVLFLAVVGTVKMIRRNNKPINFNLDY